MTLLTTGPIENNVNSENNTRLTQQATVKIDNWSGQDASTVLIEGYYMNEERVQYVCDLLKVMPHQVITRNYFADFDAFEFFFTTEDLPTNPIQISFWGKDSTEKLVAPHRLVSSELSGYVGATGATGDITNHRYMIPVLNVNKIG
ncbi:hypothetical protein M2444_001920 [Paenibacillus sp. PastF-3]|uniref:hypothetical protein n=1 Tax=Paenibacillus sp. PastF-3 TaxID=2940626 RepID=UPI0024739B42|nr:hypothetical protein [Paenibacillus sp. PastF-3]MDH6370142.1 hypothetical protein [Paenibacillus sp. PastF-3]